MSLIIVLMNNKRVRCANQLCFAMNSSHLWGTTHISYDSENLPSNGEILASDHEISTREVSVNGARGIFSVSI